MEEQEVSQTYLKGFNNGYQLAKHEPELLDTLLKAKSQGSEYLKALEAGKRQHQKEIIMEQMKQQTKQQSQSRDKGRGL